MENFARVHAYPELAVGEALGHPACVDHRHTGLHFYCGTHGLPGVELVRFWASKDRKNSVAYELVDRSIVPENFLSEDVKVIIEHVDDHLGIQIGACPGEPSQVGQEDRNDGFFSPRLKPSLAGFLQEPAADFRREICQEMLEGPVVLSDFMLEQLIGDGGSGVVGHGEEELQVILGKCQAFFRVVHEEDTDAFFLPHKGGVHAGADPDGRHAL